MPMYIVYDSRAGAGDTEEASVLECFDRDDDNDAAAIEEAREDWRQQGAVVYKYYPDPNTPRNLIKETYVGHVDDYHTFPRKKKK